MRACVRACVCVCGGGGGVGGGSMREMIPLVGGIFLIQNVSKSDSNAF